MELADLEEQRIQEQEVLVDLLVLYEMVVIMVEVVVVWMDLTEELDLLVL